jgi:hypothetical protein
VIGTKHHQTPFGCSAVFSLAESDMATRTKKKDSTEVVSSGVNPRLKRNGRLTAIGKAKSLQIGMDGVQSLESPIAVIERLMIELGVGRDIATQEYRRAEVEFRLRYTPFSKEQCDAAVQSALKDVLTDKEATPSARVSAAKEFKKLFGEDFEDDQARCSHYESLWVRKIAALSRMGHEQMLACRDDIADEDFDLFAINEREVEMLEEKAG